MIFGEFFLYVHNIIMYVVLEESYIQEHTRYVLATFLKSNNIIYVCTYVVVLYLSGLHTTGYVKDKFKEQQTNVHKFSFLQTHRVHNLHIIFLTGYRVATCYVMLCLHYSLYRLYFLIVRTLHVTCVYRYV